MQLARSANRLSAVSGHTLVSLKNEIVDHRLVLRYSSNTHHCEFDSIIYDDWRIVTVRLVCLVVEVLLGV